MTDAPLETCRALDAQIIALQIRNLMFHLSQEKTSRNSKYPIHLALGHENLAACCSVVKKPGDKFTLTHRNIHFNAALSPPNLYPLIIDEALALPTGLNHGQFGCMSMRSIGAGVVYSSSILANNIPIGLGVSSTLEYGSVCWIQTGDGAIEEGCFYESLVFARARKLPCIFLVENNNWSLGTSITERRSYLDLLRLAKSIGLEYFYIQKNETLEDTITILDDARNQAILGPVIVEATVITQGGYYHTSRGYISYHHGPLSSEHV